VSTDGSRFQLQAPFRSHKSAFTSQFLVRFSNNSWLESTQSSGWVSSGQLKPLSALPKGLRSPVFAGPDRTPKFNATWSGSRFLDNLSAHNSCAKSPAGLPQASCAISRAELSLHSSCLDHRPVSLSSVETLRCAQVCTLPLSSSQPPIPGSRTDLGRDSAPGSLAYRCGSCELLMSCLASGSLSRSTQAADPISRVALSLLSSWPRERTVSFSSVETLRRALVCTLPLTAPHLSMFL